MVYSVRAFQSLQNSNIIRTVSQICNEYYCKKKKKVWFTLIEINESAHLFFKTAN